ncbi:hypothetical protein DVR12_02275 [Chitinophaga silvatica]|uniref:Uncharacterized protein n=1 Tax=Chitinophaga silvatica TaxID=2282649 RepID=A0A3E1YGY0_9BACT|nr:hypothetical protein [Chitinophaga silvatica]RFS26636.1 hypothetical protein DVR12_02275 [Chitinophaga silvatica]
MHKPFYILIPVLLISDPTSGQAVIDIKNTNEVIIDRIEPVPFNTTIRKNISLILPDSLGGSKVTGSSILELFINKNAKLDSFKIVTLSTYLDKKEIFKYYQDDRSNKEIIKFYPVISTYLRKSLVIKKMTENTAVKDVTIIYLPIRFNKIK